MSPIHIATNTGTEMRERKLAPSIVPPTPHSTSPVAAKRSLAFRVRFKGFGVSMAGVIHAGSETIMATAMQAV
jgi:hypothetical protein